MTEPKKNLFGKLLEKEGFYKASTIIQDLALKLPQRESAYSTSPSVSWLSANGFVPGTMSLWFGPKSSGKTMLTMDLLKNFLAQEEDAIVVFVDAEMSFEYEETLRWMAANGLDLDRVMVFRGVCIKTIFAKKLLGEVQLAIVEEGVKVAAICMDSIQAMSVIDNPETESQIKKAVKDDSLTKQDYGARANYLSRIFPFYRKFCRDHRIHTMFIGQARSGGEDRFGNQIWETNGGEALYHEIQYKFLITPAGEPILHPTDKDSNGNPIKIGHRIKVVCQKNKMGEGQDRIGWTNIEYMKGIVEVEQELIEVASKLGIINQAGAWLEYSGEKFNGSKKMAERLKSDPLLYKEIFNKVMFRANTGAA